MRLIAPLWRRLPNQVNWWLLGWEQARVMVSVAGIMRDDAGRVLLLRHRFWNGRAWGLPSGYARRGEDPADALAREVREETGLTLTNITLLRVHAYPRWIEILYAARCAPGPVHLEAREILAAEFCSPESLPPDIPERYRSLIQATE